MESSLAPHLIFCHGFGFDASFWDPLLPYLYDIPCTFLELGYFKAPSQNITSLPQGFRYIGVGHSLGFIKLITHACAPTLDAYIGINAFFNFLGHGSPLYEQRLHEWKVLSRNIKRNPNQTLINFYKRCHVPVPNHHKITEDGFLRAQADLALLKASYAPPACPIYMLNTDSDPVAPLFTHAPSKTESHTDLFILYDQEPGFTHSLVHHDPKWTATRIKRFIAQLPIK